MRKTNSVFYFSAKGELLKAVKKIFKMYTCFNYLCI